MTRGEHVYSQGSPDDYRKPKQDRGSDREQNDKEFEELVNEARNIDFAGRDAYSFFAKIDKKLRAVIDEEYLDTEGRSPVQDAKKYIQLLKVVNDRYIGNPDENEAVINKIREYLIELSDGYNAKVIVQNRELHRRENLAAEAEVLSGIADMLPFEVAERLGNVMYRRATLKYARAGKLDDVRRMIDTYAKRSGKDEGYFAEKFAVCIAKLIDFDHPHTIASAADTLEIIYSEQNIQKMGLVELDDFIYYANRLSEIGKTKELSDEDTILLERIIKKLKKLQKILDDKMDE